MYTYAEIQKRSIIITTVHTLHTHAGWWLKFTFFGSYFKEQRMRSGGFWYVLGPVDVAQKSVGQQFHVPCDRFGNRNPHGAQRGPRTETIESHNENEKNCNIKYFLTYKHFLASTNKDKPNVQNLLLLKNLHRWFNALCFLEPIKKGDTPSAAALIPS